MALSNSLLESLYASIPGPSAAARWADLAQRLNRLAHRRWSATYVQSVASGSIAATATMQRACAELAASMDGAPAHLATALPASVYSAADNPIGDAYVMGRARACEKCGARFVGSVPWRRYCPSCHPPA